MKNKKRSSVSLLDRWESDDDYAPAMFSAKKKKETALNRAIMFLQGGKGSGNFGHAGRPGKVGGSAKGGSGSEDEGWYIKKIVAEKVEHLAFFTKDGYIISRSSGNEEAVTVKSEHIPDIRKEATLSVHNHPGGWSSFSGNDHKANHNLGIEKMIAVGVYKGQPIKYTFEVGEDYLSLSTSTVEQFYRSARIVAKQSGKKLLDAGMDIEEVNYRTTHKINEIYVQMIEQKTGRKVKYTREAFDYD